MSSIFNPAVLASRLSASWPPPGSCRGCQRDCGQCRGLGAGGWRVCPLELRPLAAAPARPASKFCYMQRKKDAGDRQETTQRNHFPRSRGSGLEVMMIRRNRILKLECCVPRQVDACLKRATTARCLVLRVLFKIYKTTFRRFPPCLLNFWSWTFWEMNHVGGSNLAIRAWKSLTHEGLESARFFGG